MRFLLLGNLTQAQDVALVVVTAPGSAALGWDKNLCTHARYVVCSGKLGCRVDAAARDAWEATMAQRWRELLDVVRKRMARGGLRSPLLAWGDEDQARGVLHRNVVVVANAAGFRFQSLLAEYAPRYGFGFVDRKRNVRSGISAGAYIASYITGAKAESSLEARLQRAPAHRRVFAVNAVLTKRTMVTMRTLRRGRRVWAVTQGLCSVPTTGERFGVMGGLLIDAYTGEVMRCIWDPLLEN